MWDSCGWHRPPSCLGMQMWSLELLWARIQERSWEKVTKVCVDAQEPLKQHQSLLVQICCVRNMSIYLFRLCLPTCAVTRHSLMPKLWAVVCFSHRHHDLNTQVKQLTWQMERDTPKEWGVMLRRANPGLWRGLFSQGKGKAHLTRECPNLLSWAITGKLDFSYQTYHLWVICDISTSHGPVLEDRLFTPCYGSQRVKLRENLGSGFSSSTISWPCFDEIGNLWCVQRDLYLTPGPFSFP
jgi:hypothetical protein